MTTVFVTGAYRSGTTLMDKLLHSQPGISVASQPFPFLWIAAKRRFLATLGSDDRYPLGHGFRERRYDAEDFLQFLTSATFDGEQLRQLAADMQSYSGALTPAAITIAGTLSGTVAEVHRDLTVELARSFGRPDATITGSKEILAEEFIPYLLASGCAVVLVVRDPRAVVASLNSGRGADYGGDTRPTLFHLRNWRKSVAYALAYAEHPLLTLVRYEDLVADTEGELQRVVERLGGQAGPVPAVLSDQHGEPWQGNSSFEAPAGRSGPPRWKTLLSPATQRYIEACAFPEMRALNYEVDHASLTANHLTSFEEPWPIRRADLAADYSTSPDHLADELRRLELLDADLNAETASEWFILPAAHSALRRRSTSS